MTFEESLEAVRVFRTRVALGGVVHPETYQQWLSDLEEALDDARSEYDLLESQNQVLREERDAAASNCVWLNEQVTKAQERAEKAEAALKEAYVVIGAAALSAGGFLRITRKAMTEIDLDGELSSWSEPDGIVYTYHPRLSPTQETDPE